MRRKRRLTQAERDLWEKVAKTADPISAKTPDADVAPPSVGPVQRKMEVRVPDFSVGSNASYARPHNIMPPVADQLRSAPLNMDAKSFGRLKRGKLKPEARIDLHGMTAAQAHRELREFILDASALSKRLVLVITGKGRKRAHDGFYPQAGVLRHQVPQWLSLPPLKQIVLQVTPAHIRHGGEGAYYVYLRRPR